ncbi:YpzG family protein [Peribacillus asahii]|uniref:Uncharacterized protein n=1 Tax=Peribacillus asahii TaxID=228899 RepID=A0A3Q9RKI6_9BACI|nr:YpzG family protein [Peribacillus asahii]AZV41374.1 hypothetical protein BAOM_0742 [Peribacillus asahii]USK70868.1 YpzG family protein [Peribacillus asahii]USK85781.1 YpzG family protein [Peribacillus asahii]
MANKRFLGKFQNPHQSPKHTWRQINGETKETQKNVILQAMTRKQS